MTNIKIFQVLILIIFLCSLGQLAQTKERELNPTELYQAAWMMIQRYYVDPTFNNQDWNNWKLGNKYKEEQIKTIDDAKKAIETMIASLNDQENRNQTRTRLVDVNNLSVEGNENNSKIQAAIGLEIKAKEREFIINPVSKEAIGAGLKTNDKLISIDDVLVNKLTLEEIAENLRGKENTKVKLLILRNNEKKEYTLNRLKSPTLTSIQAEQLSKKTCYLYIQTFQNSFTSNEIREQMDKFKNCPNLIIDLRNNTGGLLDEVKHTLSLFLENNLSIGTLIDRAGKNMFKEKEDTDNNSDIYKGEIVVLIGKHTLSGAEIFAAALKDNDKAILVGEKTAGNAFVGLVRPLSFKYETKLNIVITTAQYFSPKGKSINKIGLQPDIFLSDDNPTFDPKTDKLILKAQSLLEKENK